MSDALGAKRPIDNFVVMMNVSGVVGDQELQIIPDHVLRRAGTEEVRFIKPVVDTLYTVPCEVSLIPGNLGGDGNLVTDRKFTEPRRPDAVLRGELPVPPPSFFCARRKPIGARTRRHFPLVLSRSFSPIAPLVHPSLA
jgi:hypothetical protein